MFTSRRCIPRCFVLFSWLPNKGPFLRLINSPVRAAYMSHQKSVTILQMHHWGIWRISTPYQPSACSQQNPQHCHTIVCGSFNACDLRFPKDVVQHLMAVWHTTVDKMKWILRQKCLHDSAPQLACQSSVTQLLEMYHEGVKRLQGKACSSHSVPTRFPTTCKGTAYRDNVKRFKTASLLWPNKKRNISGKSHDAQFLHLLEAILKHSYSRERW